MYKPFALFTVISLTLALLTIGGCKSGDGGTSSYSPTSPSPTPSPTPSAPNTVAMSGMAFSPATITVAKNTTITWQNNDSMAHTSTSDSGLWDTGNMAPGASTTTTFANAGTFTYHCTYHSGMKGTIIVQ